MKAFGKTIVLSQVREEIRNKVGLIVTDPNDREIRFKLGDVFSVGDLVKEIKPGDKIYFDKTSSSEIRLGGEKYLIISENDVRVIL